MERVEDILSPLKLEQGDHGSYEEGMCAMEAVAWLSGEDITDAPKCACPVLSTFVTKINDILDDDDRQKLVPYILGLLGTVSKEHEKERLDIIIGGYICASSLFPLSEDTLSTRMKLVRNRVREMYFRYDSYNETAMDGFLKLMVDLMSPMTIGTALEMLPYLEKAIRVGPNGFDDNDTYVEPAKALRQHAIEQYATV